MRDDAAEITRIINLYGFTIDTQQWHLFDRIFTPDVTVDFGGATQWSDLATFKRDFAAYHDPFDGTQHSMTVHLIEVHGDAAHAFCYGNWRLIRRGMEGGDLWEGTGWYDDVLTRTADGWRIAKRACRVMYCHGNPLVNEPIPGVKFEAKFERLRAYAERGEIGFLNALT